MDSAEMESIHTQVPYATYYQAFSPSCTMFHTLSKQESSFWQQLICRVICQINPVLNDKFKTLPNCKSLQTTNSNLRKMAEISQTHKTQWEKEKLLAMSNFSFSCSVFKRFVLQTCKNQGLFGKGLNTLNLVLGLYNAMLKDIRR